MRAMVIDAAGDATNFHEAEVDQGPLAPGRLRVRVMATSVNPVDCKIRKLGLEIGPEYPAILHGDVAGVVEAVGKGVSAFKKGDHVFGCAGGVRGVPGALAERMDCDADLMALMPSSLNFLQAAALPLVAITAWEGLVDRARVEPGQKVLIHAGAGGVGHVAVQLAATRGADVFATVSSDAKAEIVDGYGATPINYREQSVADYVAEHTDGEGFDVVYDTVGGATIPASWEAARPGGIVVSCQSSSEHDMTPMHRKALTHSAVLMLLPLLTGRGRAHHGEIMRQVAHLADSGEIKPLLDDSEFALEAVSSAHERWESGEAVGKIPIRVGA